MNRRVRYLRMALFVLLAVLPGAVGCVIGGGEVESKVDWVYSLDEALSLAQSGNKPVIIDFYAGWCAPCKKMDSNTYSDDSVGAFINENFAPLKVDVDRSNVDGPFGISSIPQVVFLSPDGKEIDRGLRIIGYVPPDAFLGRLQTALDAWDSGIG